VCSMFDKLDHRSVNISTLYSASQQRQFHIMWCTDDGCEDDYNANANTSVYDTVITHQEYSHCTSSPSPMQMKRQSQTKIMDWT